MQFISLVGRFLVRLGRSFIILLRSIFIGIPLRLLMLIFPSLRHRVESLSQSSASQSISYQERYEAIQNMITPNQQVYLDFLMQVLQRVADDPNPQSVYPFLQQNLDKLDETLGQVLEDWAKETLPQANPQEADYIADVIVTFSNLIQQFPLGNIATNQEIALTACQIALNVYTFEAFPNFWAMTQNHLAVAYIHRIRGDKAENLERAIAACNEALTICTFEAFPIPWAMIQNNLAAAYTDRIIGNKADNLELAITACNEALQIFTFEAFPYEWITTQNSLANAYLERIRGDKADNLEKVIAAYQIALQVRDFEAFPRAWVSMQNNLARAYRDRIRGDKADNLEKAISACQEALTICTFEEFPYPWAKTQGNLATAYTDRIKGDKADNLETAIAAYQDALQVHTFESFPKDWAATKNNLAIAYTDRIRGDKEDNLELAIAACQDAFKVHTFESFPQQWAVTQNNLAIAYTDRIRGDKEDNLELAITAYQEALKVYTFEAFPQDWAGKQLKLGNVYLHRIRGDRFNNLEEAINCFQETLEVYTFEAFPQEWASAQSCLAFSYVETIRTDGAENLELAIAACNNALQVFTFEVFRENWASMQINLAAAYSHRIRGDRADNLELAITYNQEALNVYTFEAFPENWAKTKLNLALAYGDRIRGDKADNLERAIAACTEALQVYTFEAFPQQWATTQWSFAVAYRHRIRGDKTENLDKVIAYNQEALKVYTFEAFPYEWASIQHNFATFYSHRSIGDKADNLEKAITYYEKALQGRTFDAFPYDWAITQNDLAIAYHDRIKGDRIENLETAITCFQNALTIYTKESNPFECFNTAKGLGSLHFRENNWQEAANAYHLAIEAVETYRLEALNPQRRQEILSEAIAAYHNIVQSYLNLNQPDKALEYVERSKTRELVELFSQKETYPKGISETIKTQLDCLRLAIINENNRLAIEEQNRNNRFGMLTNEPREQAILIDYTHLNQLRQQLDEFIEREITPIDPDFILTQEVKPIPFNEIQSLTDEHTAILEWYITGNKILVFVIPPNPPFKGGNHGEVRVWQSSAEDRQALIDWINEYLGTYYQNKNEYIKTLSSRLSRLSELLHINEILEYEELKNSDRLIIIPHWFLHLLPLHTLPVTLNSEGASLAPLQNKFTKGVTYAPSCQILQRIQNRNRPHFNNLFAIQDPGKNLLFANLEVETIHTLFDQATILVKEQATETALTNHADFFNAHCIHFSCHGTFNLISPLESALILANKDRLELGEIFQLNLNQCRLIVLSACETGLIDTNSLSDEYFGLPSGFLFAGSQTVVSSLWTVNDLSTAFLMIKFYEQLPKHPQKGEITIALKQAQNWLRYLTCQEFVIELNKYQLKIQQVKSKLSVEDFRNIYDVIEDTIFYINKLNPHDKPFDNPFYWAAFITTGF